MNKLSIVLLFFLLSTSVDSAEKKDSLINIVSPDNMRVEKTLEIVKELEKTFTQNEKVINDLKKQIKQIIFLIDSLDIDTNELNFLNYDSLKIKKDSILINNDMVRGKNE